MTIFDGASLTTAVTETLASAEIPAGHRHAFVLVATLAGGVKAVVSTKFGDVWQIDSVVHYQPGAGLDAGVQIKATW